MTIESLLPAGTPEELEHKAQCPFFWKTTGCPQCNHIINGENQFCKNCGLSGVNFCGQCAIFECPEHQMPEKSEDIEPRTVFRQSGQKYHHTIMPADLGLPAEFDTDDTDDPNWRKNLFPK